MGMRALFSAPVVFAFLLGATSAQAQPAPQTRLSRSTESLRGVSAVSQKIAWASGTHGTYLRTTDGHIWIPYQVPGAESLDFRAVVAFSADEAFVMSAGPGDQSRIYHTLNAGRNWNLQLTNTNPKGFFDSMVFWDRTHGIVLGDPIPDESGNLKFELLMTEDGQNWKPIPAAQLPPAIEGEGAFAASNSCLAILPSPASLQLASASNSVIPSEARDHGFADATHAAGPAQPLMQPWKSGASAPRDAPEKEGASAPDAPDPNIWFATGGKVARVFHSPDRGHTWEVFDTPIAHGPDSFGIFSIAFRDPNHGIIAGGDYKHPDQNGPNLAFTNDGGKTWKLSEIFPQSYYSAVAYDRRSLTQTLSSRPKQSVPERNGSRSGGTCCSDANNALDDNQAHIRIFLVGPKFIYDFRPPRNPTRISPRKGSELRFNAVSPYPTGGALFAGPKGSLATVP